MSFNSLLDVRRKCDECRACELGESRLNVVFGKGNENADILFIGEAPGAKEDEVGLPFVGRAGNELDKLLGRLGLGLDDVYIANILKCRPPKNRDPKPFEIKKCTPYLIEQIKLIKPKVIATLGNYATKFVLAKFDVDGMKKVEGISKVHGKCFELEVEGFCVKVIPIYHPSAMMYRPSLREEFKEDFKTIAKVMGLEFKAEEVQKKLI